MNQTHQCLVHGITCLKCSIAMEYEIDLLKKQKDMLLAAMKTLSPLSSRCLADCLRELKLSAERCKKAIAAGSPASGRAIFKSHDPNQEIK